MICQTMFRRGGNVIYLGQTLVPFNYLRASYLHSSHSLLAKKLDLKEDQSKDDNDKLDTFIHDLKNKRLSKWQKIPETPKTPRNLSKVSKDFVPNIKSGTLRYDQKYVSHNANKKEIIEIQLSAKNAIKSIKETPSSDVTGIKTAEDLPKTNFKKNTQTIRFDSFQSESLQTSTEIDKNFIPDKTKQKETFSSNSESLKSNSVSVNFPSIEQQLLEKIHVEKDFFKKTAASQKAHHNLSHSRHPLVPRKIKTNKLFVNTSNTPAQAKSKTNKVDPLNCGGEKGANETPPKRKHKRKKDKYVRSLLHDGKTAEALAIIESAVGKDTEQNLFDLFNSFCAVACTYGSVEEIARVKQLAEMCNPRLYWQEMCFDHYLARAFCHGGNYKRSFEIIMEMYSRRMKTRKFNDIITLIILKAMESNDVKQEEMVYNFVDIIARQRQFHPALVLWRRVFTSSLYRHQKMAESIVDNYPKLMLLIPWKLDVIIQTAYSNKDKELLSRIIELLLKLQLEEHYSTAITALMEYQCDSDDLIGVNQSLKFVHKMEIRLKPEIIQRVHNFIKRHNQVAAPILPLDMKYRLPPKPVIKRPAEFQYKFGF